MLQKSPTNGKFIKVLFIFLILEVMKLFFLLLVTVANPSIKRTNFSRNRVQASRKGTGQLSKYGIIGRTVG